MKKTLLSGIAALLLTVEVAHAQFPATRFGPIQEHAWREQQILPPEEYDHEYPGTLTVFKNMRQENIPLQCPGSNRFACARADHFGPNTCAIWIIKKDEIEKQGWDYDIIMRHEIGHCNGWHHQ